MHVTLPYGRDCRRNDAAVIRAVAGTRLPDCLARAMNYFGCLPTKRASGAVHAMSGSRPMQPC